MNSPEEDMKALTDLGYYVDTSMRPSLVLLSVVRQLAERMQELSMVISDQVKPPPEQTSSSLETHVRMKEWFDAQQQSVKKCP